MGILDYYGAVSMTEMDDFPDTLEHHLETSPEGMEMGVNLREHPGACSPGNGCDLYPPGDQAPACVDHARNEGPQGESLSECAFI